MNRRLSSVFWGNLLTFWLILGTNCTYAQNDNLLIVGQNTLTPNHILDKVWFRVDSTKNIPFESIHQNPMFFKQKAALSNTLEQDCYWITFEAYNPDSAYYDLIFNFDQWDNVDFYWKENGKITHKKTGHTIPFSFRDVKMANHAYIRLPFAPKSKKICWVRLQKRLESESE